MAEPLLRVVLQNLNSLMEGEVGLLWGVDKEMRRLDSVLSTIRAVLEDAEEKKLQDKAIKNWLRKLKGAFYELDDILDECATEASLMKFRRQNSGLLKKLCNSLTYPVSNISFRHKIGNRMKEIKQTLDSIADERSQFHLREVLVDNWVKYNPRRETGSILTQSKVYGRDEDKENIVNLLLGNAVNEDVRVYPILGMGGLGKTTLAQMVFNDEKVIKYFEPRIWICVSEEFDVKRLIKEIIESVSGSPCEMVSQAPLERELQNKLNGKRYLIILDDVWNENQDDWDSLKHVLSCGSKGSSIIVTTRLEKVVLITGTLPPHRLSLLSENDCWLLFKERAFGYKNKECSKLIAIGKEIVKKCKGVPLAAKALGGLLSFKSEQREWQFIEKSEIWELHEHEESIMPSLKLSFYNLPSELKQCFAYCALFPKDSKIKKEKLIHLWMANGFILSKGNIEPEDIGNEIWNELCWRSFFQDVQKNKYSGEITFKMHDLMHDLAQSVMEDESHIMDLKISTSIPKQGVRHVTLLDFWGSTFLDSLYRFKSLKSILRQGDGQTVNGDKLSRKLTNFGSLRALDASVAEQLSSSIGNLIHLRYLNLSHSGIKMLPDTICTLHNLQTLNLNNCVELRRLPKKMKNLISLRHLFLENWTSLVSMPPKLRQLTLLKTLSLFVVGKSKDDQLSELQHMDLRGRLVIEHVERVRNPVEAKEANLIGKQNLRLMEFNWDSEETNCSKPVEEIFEALEPHPNVKELFVNGFKGTHFPRWINNSVLKNTVNLTLHKCRNCSQLPPLGQLPSLRNLIIWSMDNVEHIDNTFPSGGPIKGFPSLKTLKLEDFPNLKGLSRVEGAELFPCLHDISIYSCPKLRLPHLSSPRKLSISACSNMNLSSISNLSLLTDLEISEAYEDVFSFPEEMLQNLMALESLKIFGFCKVKVLPESMASLLSLKSLEILNCEELECLSDHVLQGPKSLQHLTICGCYNIKSLSENLGQQTALKSLTLGIGCPKVAVDLVEGIRHLNSLQSLYIYGEGSSNVEAIPELLQHLPALNCLSVYDFPNLAFLPEWFGKLPSLQYLDIADCPMISSLPESIRCLTNLRQLRIFDPTPQLQRRCEKEKGEDWYKIAHIPDVRIRP